MTSTELIWNRACEGGGPNLLAGDYALAALLKAHGLAMNGGVLHAVECLADSELSDAEDGYRYFGLGAVADLLSGALKIAKSDEDLETYESQFDEDYSALIPDDSALSDQFMSIYAARPGEFSSV